MKLLKFCEYIETLCIKRKLQFHTRAEADEFQEEIQTSTFAEEFTRNLEKAPLCFYFNGPLTYHQCKYLAFRAGVGKRFMAIADEDLLEKMDPVKALQKLNVI